MNFPSAHRLNQTERSRTLIADADVILGLEVWDFWGTVNNFRDQLHRTSRPIIKSGAKLISVSTTDLNTKSNYQDFQRFPDLDLSMAADAEATLPALIEACRRLLTDDRKRAYQERAKKLAEAQQETRKRVLAEASYGWDASPISTARMSMEIWAQVKDRDWSLVSNNAWAAEAMDLRQTLSVHRRIGWRRRRLRCAGRVGRGCGQQEIRAAVRKHPE